MLPGRVMWRLDSGSDDHSRDARTRSTLCGPLPLRPAPGACAPYQLAALMDRQLIGRSKRQGIGSIVVSDDACCRQRGWSGRRFAVKRLTFTPADLLGPADVVVGSNP
jgi:hypothetical protein